MMNREVTGFNNGMFMELQLQKGCRRVLVGNCQLVSCDTVVVHLRQCHRNLQFLRRNEVRNLEQNISQKQRSTYLQTEGLKIFTYNQDVIRRSMEMLKLFNFLGRSYIDTTAL